MLQGEGRKILVEGYVCSFELQGAAITGCLHDSLLKLKIGETADYVSGRICFSAALAERTVCSHKSNGGFFRFPHELVKEGRQRVFQVGIIDLFRDASAGPRAVMLAGDVDACPTSVMGEAGPCALAAGLEGASSSVMGLSALTVLLCGVLCIGVALALVFLPIGLRAAVSAEPCFCFLPSCAGARLLCGHSSPASKPRPALFIFI